MIFKFETEDEKGILHSSSIHNDPFPIVACKVIQAHIFEPEAIYLTRWADGYNYEGTAFDKKNILYIQIVDNQLFYLFEKERGKFKKGKPISSCRHARSLLLR